MKALTKVTLLFFALFLIVSTGLPYAANKIYATSVNLAQGKAATSNVASCSTSEGAANAVDHDLNTHWCSTAAGDKWLRIDLGAATSFNRWVVKHAQTADENPEFNTRDFKLQISNDGSSFTDLDAVTGNTSAITNRQVSSSNARYVRLYVSTPTQNGSSTVRIREIELYNDTYPSDSNLYVFDMKSYLQSYKSAIGADEFTPNARYVKLSISVPNQNAESETIRIPELELYYNLALGKTATASDANSATETAAQAVDGSTDTHWASSSSGPRWLTVDLGSSKTIVKWIVRHAESGGEPASYNTRNFKLQYSSDGVNYADADTVSGNTASVTDRGISAVKGRYFRLYVTTPNQVSGSNIVRIREFELYQEGNLALNKTATATSINSAGESGAQAVDGNLSTHWCSTASGVQNLVVDLGSAKKFNRWVVKNAGASGESAAYNAMNYGLDISSDNSFFTGIDGVSGNSANVTDRSLAPRYATEYAYDFLKMAATAQGMINRDGPKVFIKWEASDEIANPRGFDPDNYWLSYLKGSGQILNGKTEVTVSNFYDLINLFSFKFAGIVAWDKNVPSTSNVASTIAGVENLLPVRYDAGASSVMTQLRNQTGLDIGVNLTGKFTGAGTIWNTSTASTGSKKGDAYTWAIQKYIVTHKVSPTLMQFAVDAYSNAQDASGTTIYKDNLYNRMLINQDYYIKNKAFFFDLQPSAAKQPNDDPTQPLGTDYNVLDAMMSAMNNYAGTSLITVGGFTQWGVKYSEFAYSGGLPTIDTEWKMVDILSKHNTQLDADAPGLMALANASVYQYVPQKTQYTQNNDKGNNNAVYDPNKRYVMIYMGDFDSAAWTAAQMPALWNRPNGRGRIPLAWSIVPNLAQRVSMAYNALYDTATAKDYFVSGDNGAGYLNSIELPSQYHANWVNFNSALFQKFDLSIAGFVITDYTDILPASIQAEYASFAPNGVGVNSSPQNNLSSGVPFIHVSDLNFGHTPMNKYWFARGLDQAINANQKFYALRTILADPDIIADGAAQYQSNHASMNVEFVDPYTFFRFYKQSLGA